MARRTLATVEPDCPVCSVPCDPEIHAATERVHAALRQRIERYLEPVTAKAPKKLREVNRNPYVAHSV